MLKNTAYNLIFSFSWQTHCICGNRLTIPQKSIPWCISKKYLTADSKNTNKNNPEFADLIRCILQFKTSGLNAINFLWSESLIYRYNLITLVSVLNLSKLLIRDEKCTFGPGYGTLKILERNTLCWTRKDHFALSLLQERLVL